MGEFVLAGKFAVAIVGLAAATLLVRHPKSYSLSNRRFDWGCLAILLISRFGLFVCLYLLLGLQVTSDVQGHYYPEGMAVLDGQLVYRDFDSSYSPLFPYLMAGVLLAWNSAKAIVLSMVPVELISLPFWLAVSRRHFDERTTRIAALLYVTSPIPLLNVAMNGQNQVWISLLLAIALWLLARRDFASGLVFGFGLAAIKLLSLLYAPVLWLFARRRIGWLRGYALIPIVVYSVFYVLAGNAILFPIERQGVHVTAGNLYFLTSLAGLDIDKPVALAISTAVTVAALATVFLVAWARGVHNRPANIIHLLSLILLTVFLFSKKSYASYFVLSFFTICLSASGAGMKLRGLLAFGALGMLASLEPSLYFRWLGAGRLNVIFASELPDGLVRWKTIAFLAWDVALVVMYAGYFVVFWKHLALPSSNQIDENGVGQ